MIKRVIKSEEDSQKQLLEALVRQGYSLEEAQDIIDARSIASQAIPHKKGFLLSAVEDEDEDENPPKDGDNSTEDEPLSEELADDEDFMADINSFEGLEGAEVSSEDALSAIQAINQIATVILDNEGLEPASLTEGEQEYILDTIDEIVAPENPSEDNEEPLEDIPAELENSYVRVYTVKGNKPKLLKSSITTKEFDGVEAVVLYGNVDDAVSDLEMDTEEPVSENIVLADTDEANADVSSHLLRLTSGWKDQDEYHERAWNHALKRFTEQAGHPPKSGKDWGVVMAIAKNSLKKYFDGGVGEDGQLPLDFLTDSYKTKVAQAVLKSAHKVRENMKSIIKSNKSSVGKSSNRPLKSATHVDIGAPDEAYYLTPEEFQKIIDAYGIPKEEFKMSINADGEIEIRSRYLKDIMKDIRQEAREERVDIEDIASFGDIWNDYSSYLTDVYKLPTEALRLTLNDFLDDINYRTGALIIGDVDNHYTGLDTDNVFALFKEDAEVLIKEKPELKSIFDEAETYVKSSVRRHSRRPLKSATHTDIGTSDETYYLTPEEFQKIIGAYGIPKEDFDMSLNDKGEIVIRSKYLSSYIKDLWAEAEEEANDDGYEYEPEIEDIAYNQMWNDYCAYLNDVYKLPNEPLWSNLNDGLYDISDEDGAFSLGGIDTLYSGLKEEAAFAVDPEAAEVLIKEKPELKSIFDEAETYVKSSVCRRSHRPLKSSRLRSRFNRRPRNLTSSSELEGGNGNSVVGANPQTSDKGFPQRNNVEDELNRDTLRASSDTTLFYEDVEQPKIVAQDLPLAGEPVNFDAEETFQLTVPLEEQSTVTVELAEVASGVYVGRKGKVVSGKSGVQFVKSSKDSIKSILPNTVLSKCDRKVVALNNSKEALYLMSSATLGLIAVKAPFIRGLRNTKYTLFNAYRGKVVSADGYQLQSSANRVIASISSNKKITPCKESFSLKDYIESAYTRYLTRKSRAVQSSTTTSASRSEVAILRRRLALKSSLLSEAQAKLNKHQLQSEVDLSAYKAQVQNKQAQELFSANQKALADAESLRKTSISSSVDKLAKLMGSL